MKAVGKRDRIWKKPVKKEAGNLHFKFRPNFNDTQTTEKERETAVFQQSSKIVLWFCKGINLTEVQFTYINLIDHLTG